MSIPWMVLAFSAGARAQSCEPAAASVISVQGDVDVSDSDRAHWRDAQLNQVLCAGQQVRLMAKSRAVLQLPNETLIHLDEGSVFTLRAIEPEKPAWLDLLRGALHIISRVPRVDITLNALDPSFRQEIKQDSARIGAHYQPTGHHDLLASFIYSDSEVITDMNVDFDDDSVDDIAAHLENPIEGYSAEIQHLFRGEGFKTISGMGYSRLRDRTVAIRRPLPGIPLPPEDTVDHREDIHAYAFVPVSLGQSATLTLGASYDSFHTAELDTHPINPKVGLVWNIFPSTYNLGRPLENMRVCSLVRIRG